MERLCLADGENYQPNLMPGALEIPANWEKIYGRKAPLIVEIGCGGGRYLISEAEKHPEFNYLAIERAAEFFNILLERVTKRRLANMRVCRTDGADLVASVFSPASVRAFHVYFPDPWPKKKHRKRRIFTPEFCTDIWRDLEPGGRFYFATDHRAYLNDVLPVIQAYIPVAEHVGPWEDAPLGRTNYEAKYMKQGRSIWRYIAQKPV